MTYTYDQLHRAFTVEPEPPPAEHASRPHVGPDDRPGTAYNAAHTGADLLEGAGFTLAHRDAQGAHYTRPGKDPRQGTSATVYADDGHTTIYSDTACAMFPGLEVRRPYDPFGLYAALRHRGDHTEASVALAAQGYGTRMARTTLTPDDLMPAPSLPDASNVPETKPGKRRIQLVAADTISPQPVRWLWQGRIPRGVLTLLGGREGIGKSTYAYDLAADVTRGKVPGIHKGSPKPVLVAATEDSWSHTIVPRLIAAGADRSIVYRIDVITPNDEQGILTLPSDIPDLIDVTNEVQAGLILLDPLLSRLDARLDTHKDAEVRIALEPLTALADETSCAVVGLIHVNKSSSEDPLTMLMASRAFAAVARAVLFVMHDPENDGMRLLGQAKNNLGRMDLETLRFEIVDTIADVTPEGDEIHTGKLKWSGQSPLSIEDALAAARDKDEKASRGDAYHWLTEYLSGRGGAAASAEIRTDCEDATHSWSTVKRARKDHENDVLIETVGRKTYWKLRNALMDTERMAK